MMTLTTGTRLNEKRRKTTATAMIEAMKKKTICATWFNHKIRNYFSHHFFFVGCCCWFVALPIHYRRAHFGGRSRNCQVQRICE